ncbi:tubulin--tyrosine ligase-like protein 12 [Hordeum vulgare subsp. vulgare]|uniref:Tubulin--tyrosine ligase-like protein 12 SET-like domain-containing protein n=1 Tax=Hordeum vulgare subsp. vulgare TaxID=112509 RepID=A0A8I6X4T1_HORVV|nr:tubulin--tyrosine ligase-like protein 12 [Hordeum vulgare subsp. vulgare]
MSPAAAAPAPRDDRIRSFEDFARVHQFLLIAAGVPPSLHRRLYRKLADEVFDGGESFSVEPCEEGRQRRLVLASGAPLGSEADVFLVDHAWSFRLSDALKQLREVPGLAERMAALMCVDLDRRIEVEEADEQDSEKGGGLEHVLKVVEKERIRIQESGGDFAAWLELEELGIDDDMLVALDLSANFPNLVALNLWGNKLQDPEKVMREIGKCGRLKALWLNENPILNQCTEKDVLDGLPELEIYNSHFTMKAREWALGFCGDMVGAENPCLSVGNIPLDNIVTLDLSDRSIHKLPEAFSSSKLSSLSKLNIRGNPLDQMSGDDLLKLFSGFTQLQELEVDIPGPLGNSAISILESLPNITLLNGVNASSIVESAKHVVDSALKPRVPEWSPEEPLAERVIGAMWLYLMTYRLADEEKFDETPIWYVMDELGSAMRHSDDANFRIAPFLFMPEGKLSSAISYTILWPICDVHTGEECTRDFLFGIGEDKQRSARLTAWFHTPENYFIQEFRKYQEQLQSTSICPTKETPSTRSVRPSDGRPLRVFTDIPQVEEFLTRPEFVLTTDPKDADIIWAGMQIDSELKSSLGLTDQQYMNQFPFEACLVMKHHLADTIHRAWGSPEWLQPTYNLETHLSQLIGEYSVRKRDGMDNLWIMKPWNMARTIDTTVSGDLSAIIRLMETGPKICQKYIECPALFQGRKFDLRYIVLVRSICPLDILLCDVFWVRLANNQYTLEKTSLFEYETHFTVMNYNGRMNHMNTPEFVKEFEKEHQVKWLEIHESIRDMIRRVFESTSAVHPEMQNSFCRAIYGVDVMLDNRFKPKILEVTYCPDCTRACQYDTQALVGSQGPIKGSDFFNTVFGCLFLDDLTNVSPL